MVSEKDFTPIQKQYFDTSSPEIQKKIRAGYPTVIIGLPDGEEICKFNMENFKPSKDEMESLARSLLPEIQKFFSTEEGRQEYEEYLKNKKRDK